MASGMNAANGRQRSKHKNKYTAQKLRTARNKAKRVARHLKKCKAAPARRARLKPIKRQARLAKKAAKKQAQPATQEPVPTTPVQA